MIKLKAFQAGHCLHAEHVILKNGNRTKCRFPFLVFLIQHPKYGNILVDTGYSQHIFDETRNFPYWLYSHVITPVIFNTDDAIAIQLRQQGLSAKAIDYVIITHFHADHISALTDFPNASFICSDLAYQSIINMGRLKALTKAFLPGLLPPDFSDRLHVLSISDFSLNPDLPGFLTHPFFDITEIQFVYLPGHAAGQLGVLIMGEPAYFLLADACWKKESFESFILPKSIVKIFTDDWGDYLSTLRHLHDIYKEKEELVMIPTHCSQSAERFRNKWLL